MNKSKNIPAFPYHETGDCGVQPGMTLRDYFAAKALVGYLSCPTEVMAPDGQDAPDVLDDKYLAYLSYSMADAMLAEREK